MKSFGSTSRSKLSSIDQKSITNTTISNKIMECWMRQNHQEYQQYLISEKEMQLQFLELQTKNKKILRGFEKKKNELQLLQSQFQQVQENTNTKKKYLHNYYQHLNDKLKSETGGISLFGKLSTLSANLEKKLEEHKKQLKQSLTNLKKNNFVLEQELKVLESKKQSLEINLKSLKDAKQKLRAEEYKKKEKEREQQLQKQNIYNTLDSQRKKMTVEKQQLQSSQNVLKQLLNIEEVHKKYWFLIEKAIKTQFTLRVASKHHKQTTRMEYKLKVNEMQGLVNRKKAELNRLRSQLGEQKKKRDAVKKQLLQNNGKFNNLENRLQGSNK